MATFKFGRAIDLHWNGYDIQGPAETVFSIPDQLYEEFDADIAPVEPTLVWLDTNEFQTLTNNVSASTLSASFPIALTTTTSGKTISLSSSTNPNGYLLAADGSGGVIFTPASTSGLTSVVGVSPISTAIAGGTVSVSLNASYQTAGNYASSVSATLPISASLSTAGAVSISIDTTGFQSSGSYQASGTYVNSVIGTSPASVSTSSGTSTVSIIGSSINSSHLADNAIVAEKIAAGAVGSAALADNAIVAAKIAAGAVGSSAISSGAATSGQLLQANGAGGAIFATVAAGATVSVSEFTATGTWTKPAGAKAVYVWLVGGGTGGNSGNRAISTASAAKSIGGAGGGGNYAIFDASILPSTVTVTIGAGGAGAIGLSGTTTTGSGTEGATGGETLFGVSGNEFLIAGTAANHSANTGGAPTWTPMMLKSSTNRNLSSLTSFETFSISGNDAQDQRGFAAAGGVSPAVESSTISANLFGGCGARGFGRFYNITAPAAGTVAGANGQSASTGFGTSGAAGGSNNTASGVNSGNGGNGGNGFRGGGGGAGGSVWASSGTARNTGSGGNGGDGYALVISW